MRILVTGASGWIGSASIPELVTAGHDVVGLARSDAAAATVAALGVDVRRGSLDDPESLRAAVAGCDGVVHLAYHHDFSQMEHAADLDRAAIDVFGEVLRGTGGPLLVASGTLGLATGRSGTEDDRPDAAVHPRVGNAAAASALAAEGVRPVLVRFAPTVHGPGDHGFVARLVEIARERGVSGYVGDGANRWPAVHRLDAARLVALAVDSAAAGSAVHAIGEEGVPTREIAETIGAVLGLPSVSVPAEEVADHFGWIGGFFATDSPATSDLTRERLGWEPTHPGLLADIKGGAYTS